MRIEKKETKICKNLIDWEKKQQNQAGKGWIPFERIAVWRIRPSAKKTANN